MNPCSRPGSHQGWRQAHFAPVPRSPLNFDHTFAGRWRKLLKLTAAQAMPLILLAFGHCGLRAQQSWPQNSPYNGQYNTQPYSSQYDRQYAPPPNNAYGQPYGQPGNAPMYGNPQQPYDSTQQYPQQDYAPSQ